MAKTKKQRRKIKQRRLRNKKLCKKYWWLKLDRNIWSGKRNKDYKYDWTWYDDIPEGWAKAFGMKLVDELHQELVKVGAQRWKNDPWKQFAIHQIKEKYGRLVIYASWTTDKMSRIIRNYEYISEHVCSICGKPDVSITDEGWIIPECYDCYRRRWRKRERNKYNKDIVPASEEEIRAAYDKCASDKYMMPDSYTFTRHYPNEKEEKEITVDISDITNAVRMRYESYQRRRSARRLSQMGT